MKIRFDSDDNDLLHLGKILSILLLIVIVKSVFQSDNRYYPQIHIHECVRMVYKKIYIAFLYFF